MANAVNPAMTKQQPMLLWSQMADSTAITTTTTETAFDQVATLPAASVTYPEWTGFAAGDRLSYYFSGVIACNSTPTIAFAVFWGTVAGAKLLGRTSTMLLTASGSDTFVVEGSVLFRSATSVVGSIAARVKTAATTAVAGAGIISALTIAQTADVEFTPAVTISAASTTYTALTREGYLWYHRYAA